MLLKFRPSK